MSVSMWIEWSCGAVVALGLVYFGYLSTCRPVSGWKVIGPMSAMGVAALVWTATSAISVAWAQCDSQQRSEALSGLVHGVWVAVVIVGVVSVLISTGIALGAVSSKGVK
jgi:hypothetical protein